ncbi:hypothetical protein CSUI_009163, partial [Cystoisospora suis]
VKFSSLPDRYQKVSQAKRRETGCNPWCFTTC